MRISAIICSICLFGCVQQRCDEPKSNYYWLYLDATDPKGAGVRVSSTQLSLVADDVFRFGVFKTQASDASSLVGGVSPDLDNRTTRNDLPPQLCQTFAGMMPYPESEHESNYEHKPVPIEYQGGLEPFRLYYGVEAIVGTRSTYVMYLDPPQGRTWRERLHDGKIYASLVEAFMSTGFDNGWSIAWRDSSENYSQDNASSKLRGLTDDELRLAKALTRAK